MRPDYDRIASALDSAIKGNGHETRLPIPPTVGLRRASQIEMEPVSWLWPGWLAAGKLHMLGGVPGTGKTTIALSLATLAFHNDGSLLEWINDG